MGYPQNSTTYLPDACYKVSTANNPGGTYRMVLKEWSPWDCCCCAILSAKR